MLPLIMVYRKEPEGSQCYNFTIPVTMITLVTVEFAGYISAIQRTIHLTAVLDLMERES